MIDLLEIPFAQIPSFKTDEGYKLLIFSWNRLLERIFQEIMVLYVEQIMAIV